MFLKALVKFQELVNREEGQDLVEYALLAALIALAAIAGISAIGTNVSIQFSKIAASV
jgi:pilus assembly protein Flp/PilA